VKCKFCKHVFVAGVSCIKENFLLINPACGVVKSKRMEQSCSLSWMRKKPVHAQSKAAAGAAAAAAAAAAQRSASLTQG